MRSDAIRADVIRILCQAPFRRFVLSMKYGDRASIGHSENLAFDPDLQSKDVYVVSNSSSRDSNSFRGSDSSRTRLILSISSCISSSLSRHS